MAQSKKKPRIQIYDDDDREQQSSTSQMEEILTVSNAGRQMRTIAVSIPVQQDVDSDGPLGCSTDPEPDMIMPAADLGSIQVEIKAKRYVNSIGTVYQIRLKYISDGFVSRMSLWRHGSDTIRVILMHALA